MVAKLLAETKIRNTKPDPSKKEQLLHDGDGLYLRFVRSESKRNIKLHNTTWLLRFTDPVRKTQTRTGLGKYPDISLAEARELAQEKRLDLAKGSRPVRETVTLAAAVERWLEECKAGMTCCVVRISCDEETFLQYLSGISLGLGEYITLESTFPFDDSMDILVKGKRHHISKFTTEHIWVIPT